MCVSGSVHESIAKGTGLCSVCVHLWAGNLGSRKELHLSVPTAPAMDPYPVQASVLLVKLCASVCSTAVHAC